MTKQILLLLLFITTHIQAQQFDSLRQESRALTQLILKKHFNNPKTDDAFSEQLFEQFIRKIDNKGLIFTQLEIKDLAIFKTQLDNELSGESWAFIPAFARVYHRAVERVIRTLEGLSKTPLNFSEEEFIQFSRTNYPGFAADETALKNRWRKWLKFRVLDIAFSKENLPENLLSIEPNLRQSIAQKYIRIFKKEADASTNTA